MEHTTPHKRDGIAIPPSLTKAQKRLFRQINEMAISVGLDHWNIVVRKAGSEERTAQLDLIKRSIARGEVVDEYTFIDDILATKMSEYFFPGQSSIHLWRSKKFRRFNYYVLERLYLVHKLAFVKDLYRVPKNIASTITEINALRNAMAHTYFPENLREYQMKGRPAPRKPITVHYRGYDIFTPMGIETFKLDCMKVIDFLLWKMKRRKELGGRVKVAKEITEAEDQ